MTYDDAVKAYGREFSAELECVGDDTVTVTNPRMTISGYVSIDEDTLTIGRAFSRQMQASFYNENAPHDYRNDIVTPTISLNVEGTMVPEQMGVFRVSSVSTSTDYNTVNLVCYDRMAELMTEQYHPVDTIASMEDVLDDICSTYNLTKAASAVVPVHPIAPTEIWSCTVSEMLGYLAGLSGKNAVIDRDGELAFVWYTETDTDITADLQHENGFEQKASADLEIQSITSGYGDNYLTVGDGYGISFINPYITIEELSAIYDEISGFQYLPCKVTWFGDPRTKEGDIVKVYDRNGNGHNCLVSVHNFSFIGGISSEIVSAGKDGLDVAFSTESPTDRKLAEIRMQYTSLQAAIVEAMAEIGGANGGVFEILDDNNDGINDGWIIRNAEGTKYILANVNGIGFWDGQNVPTMAMLTSGSINASAITTGYLNADRIQVNGYTLDDYFQVLNLGGTVTVRLGDSTNGLVLQQTGSALTFTDTALNEVIVMNASTGEFLLNNFRRMVLGGVAFTEQGAGNLVIDMA